MHSISDTNSSTCRDARRASPHPEWQCIYPAECFFVGPAPRRRTTLNWTCTAETHAVRLYRYMLSSGTCLSNLHPKNKKNQTQPLPSATRLEQALGRLWSRSVKRSADVRRPQEQDLSERSEFFLLVGLHQTK